jgi:hypothetical protein
MPKSIAITPRIEQLISRNNGGEHIDLHSIAVFEASVLNTRPLSQPGSLFDKGVTTIETLNQMATYLNSGGLVPLQTLHQNGDELPVGRFFYGEVLPSTTGDGSNELVCLFYLPKSESDLVMKMDNGIIDEVSASLVAQHLLCSTCSWDWRSADATFANFYDRTCGNDHVLGADGVHLSISGLDRWTETSLVSKGAANNAKILGRTKQRLGQEQYDRLAASGIVPEQLMLIATTTETRSPKMDKDMTELIEGLATTRASLTLKETELATANARITELTGETTRLSAEVATLKAGTTLTETTAQLTAAQAQVTELTAAAAASATELADTKAKLTTAEAQIAVLQAGAGAGGRGEGAGAGSSREVRPSARNNAFKAPPR